VQVGERVDGGGELLQRLDLGRTDAEIGELRGPLEGRLEDGGAVADAADA